MPEQDLTTKIKTVGADEASKDFERLADGQAGVGKQTRAAGEASKQAAKQADSFKASESDVIALLTQASPTLGAFADSLLKSGKLAGDLASRNINLKETFTGLAGAIKANAGAFKLLLAGGAVAAGIWLIVKALEAERRASERVTKALKDQTAAQNELKGQERDRAAAIEALRDASRRGPFDEDEARAAAETAGKISKRSPFIDESAIDRAVAAVGGAEDKRGGGRLGIDEIEQLAMILGRFGEQIDLSLSGKAIDKQVDQMLEHFGPKLAEIFDREAVQRRESLQEAGKTTVSIGGATLDIEDYIKRNAPAGTDTARMAELWQRYGKLEGLEKYEGRIDPGKDVPVKMPGDWWKWVGQVAGSDEERAQLRILMEELRAELARGRGKEPETGDPDTAKAAELHAQALDAANQQLTAARMNKEAAQIAEQTAEKNRRTAAQPATVHQHMNHARFVVPGVKGIVTNGENRQGRREVG